MPQSSINFVTAHDGYTLADVVSYTGKHNEANGEKNADGNNNNRSTNCGVEGTTTEPDVLALRARLQRALLATLFLSQGVPMLVAGDEQGRTQNGNNNAYCQDNPTSWIHWDVTERSQSLCKFTAQLIELRRKHPALHRITWFDGSPSVLGERDIAWLWRDGNEMTPEQWENRANRCFGFRLGRNHESETALLVLPPPIAGNWTLLLDTTQEAWARTDTSAGYAASVMVPARGLLVLSCAPVCREP
jgi:glycogen operon protein